MIDELFRVVYVLSFIVFIIVEGLIIYAVIKFRRRRADEMPEQVHGNTAAEIGWTVVPALAVGVVFGFSVDTLNRMTARGSPTAPLAHVHSLNDTEARRRIEEAKQVDLVIEVVGRQWVWQYTYPDGKLTTNETLVVPAGKTIRLDLTTPDVIHAWWMPAFGPMIYVNPGEVSYVWFNVPPGEYIGQCNVFCGVAHAQMISKVRALPQDEYERWYQEQLAALSGPTATGDPQRGQDIFMNQNICWSCHSIEGTKAQGKVAPRTLTGFANYDTIAEVVPNTADNLRAWLHDPQAIKPGTTMPNLNLSAQDIEDLVAYLQTLK
ncbi:MAG: cytochrome c oxidase subunit II [Anaerolineae bacterium]|nr:cytochrome c oxidase subunit II [Thermoflexales bacterium]MDW8407859.1 cytochrome c oxidase subunit II [Anaerolineae bacterium]